MTTDRQFEDFLVGQLGARTGSIHNEMGLEAGGHTYKPPVYVPPIHPPTDTPNLPVQPHAPPRPLTPAEQKEINRRKWNMQQIFKVPKFFDRLSGKVFSYLDENNKLLVNETGDFVEPELVKKTEHRQRLSNAYRMYYEHVLEVSGEKINESEKFKLAHDDATERLALLRRGIYLSPFKNLREAWFNDDMFRIKKSIFGKRRIRNKYSKVHIADYDRHCRYFIHRVYSTNRFYPRPGGACMKPHLGGDSLNSLPARTVFAYFLSAPNRSGKVWPFFS